MIRQTIAAILVAAAVSSGCTFTPLYSDRNNMGFAFDFGSPTTRLEQVIYNELSLRFASSEAPNTPDLIITASAAHAGRFLSASRVAGDHSMVTVTATARAVYQGTEVFSAVRSATAEYRTSNQVVTTEQSRVEAEERAAKAAAESLRLALLAQFPKNASYMRPQP